MRDTSTCGRLVSQEPCKYWGCITCKTSRDVKRCAQITKTNQFLASSIDGSYCLCARCFISRKVETVIGFCGVRVPTQRESQEPLLSFRKGHTWQLLTWPNGRTLVWDHANGAPDVEKCGPLLGCACMCPCCMLWYVWRHMDAWSCAAIDSHIPHIVHVLPPSYSKCSVCHLSARHARRFAPSRAMSDPHPTSLRLHCLWGPWALCLR